MAAAPQPALWPANVAAARIPASADIFVAKLLASMSLEDKVAQMIQADIGAVTPEDERRYRLGSVLAGGGAAPAGYLRTTAQAWRELADGFMRASRAADGSGHVPIPVLFGIDAVHGHAKIIGATIFPQNVGLGATHDPELLRRIGAATAEEVAATGIHWTFAPTVAVARDVRWGRSYESYSEAPGLITQYAAAMVSGLQGESGAADFLGPGHTLASVKHFVGDGATRDGRDQGDAQISEALLARVHGAGYAGGLQAGALIVMASYNSWQGVKSHGNHYLLTDILKGRMGFKGFVVGDWNAHEQIPGCTKYSCPAAILAGVDMLMAPDSWRQLLANTLAQVRAGTIPQSRIDDAVTRILRVKVIAGLFAADSPKAAAADLGVLGAAAHRTLAREAVRRSLVLLKNNRQTLPLNPAAKVLVAGPGADDIGMQSGGWTVDWQGDHNLNADFPGATSIYAGIRAAVAAAGGQAQLSVDGTYSERPDAAIVVFGETPYAEFEGDRETLELETAGSSLALMQRLRAAHIPVVAVLLSGRPLWVNPEINVADAFVAAWLPGSEGAGVADVLFKPATGAAGFDFAGRLSFSWPATALPVRFDAHDRVHGAVFARGYGLDYAHPTQLGALSLDAHVPSPVTPDRALYYGGHVTAPWSIFLADELAPVRMTGSRRASPQGAVTAQQDGGAVRVEWRGEASGWFWISGRPEDLRARAAAGEQLVIRYRVLTAPAATVRLGVRCADAYRRDPPLAAVADAPPTVAAELCGTVAGALQDVTPALRGAVGRGWQQLAIPLHCLAGKGAVLADVEAPLAIETAGRLGLAIGAAGFEHGAATAKCPGGM